MSNTQVIAAKMWLENGKVMTKYYTAEEVYKPEIDCRQCDHLIEMKNSDVCYRAREGECTNGHKFVKLPAVQLWRKG